MYKILAINPGSTSTKVALYHDDERVSQKSIEHSGDDLAIFKDINSQFHYRAEAVLEFLRESGTKPEELSAIASRGGMLPAIKTGAYRINEKMVETLRERPVRKHAANLAAMIAYDISAERGIPAYIYDAIVADELTDEARISGLKELPRISLTHVLNMRAMAIKHAAAVNKSYNSLNLIVAHIGGGVSVSLHHNGRIIDIVSDDEGAFSPERPGRLQLNQFLKMCYQHTREEMEKFLSGRGGLMSYFGTNNAIEIERRVLSGDRQARLVYEAMGAQLAKSIGELATVTRGVVDGIILTGGMAFSTLLCDIITERVSFISPVIRLPGENELESLAFGILRVLRGEEQAREYE